MNTNSIALGKRIKSEREVRNISTAEFAEFLDIPESSLIDYENGIFKMNLDDVYDMLNFFKTPYSTLNENDEEIIELAKYCEKFGFDTVLKIMRCLDRTCDSLNIKASK